jgi:nucleolar protein 15
MRAYFSQFGTVNHVRLSRSKKTGNSKHYAFIEFASSEVAKIVADTMNNYLMFGHILKCSVIPKEQVHPSMWKGADKRFKKVPWNKLEARKIALPASRDTWTKRVETEKKKRDSKAEKTKEKLGYEFTGGQLKSVDEVPAKKRKAAEAVEDTEIEKTVVVAEGSGTLVITEEVKTKKVKKSGKEQKDVAKSGAKEGQGDDVLEKVKKTMKKAEKVVEEGMDEVADKAPEAAQTAVEKMDNVTAEVVEKAKKPRGRPKKSLA